MTAPDLDPDVPVGPATPVAALMLVVAAGGALGASTRFGVSTIFPGLPSTLGINVVGSFLLGVLVARKPYGRWSRPFLGTGILGGFTTMSTLAVDTVKAPPATAIFYLVSSMVLGIGAAAVGLRCRP